ncbi:hypothetical protein DSO57_1024897 [Entomophthora muscae]|uniref:Uncharacterized protein n=1 Tax=Entomophthora muscae TaxID=34485 RepID=A0ACC2SF18_9FUNG|nr:hypothetical protein DSO57_1024897 [Entomophthora muscae]
MMLGWLLFALEYVLSASLKAEGRIIGGEAAEVPEWIAESFYKGVHRCGVTFLSSNHVITAAHCGNASDSSNMLVRYNNQDLSVTSINNHPKFEGTETYGNDISIWTIDSPTNPPRSFPALPANHVTGNVTVYGWGVTAYNTTGTSKELRSIDLTIFASNVCKEKFNTRNITFNEKSHICIGNIEGGHDACQGDSGGPAISNQNGSNFLVGLVSYGYRCAEKGFPAAYTDILAFGTFINDSFGQNSPSPPASTPTQMVPSATPFFPNYIIQQGIYMYPVGPFQPSY